MVNSGHKTLALLVCNIGEDVTRYKKNNKLIKYKYQQTLYCKMFFSLYLLLFPYPKYHIYTHPEDEGLIVMFIDIIFTGRADRTY